MNIKSAEEHLLNPPPGSAAARARDFGVDLTLTLQRLRLTPDERLRQLQRAMIEIENMREYERPKDSLVLPELEALREVTGED
jgi:hypothetical protein